MKKGFESIFECTHFDWMHPKYQNNKVLLNTNLLEVFRLTMPAIVFMHIQDDGIVDLHVVQFMKQYAIVINWTGDVRHPIPEHYIKIGKEIHLTLFTNMNDVISIRELGVDSDFLQVGFDSDYFNPLPVPYGKYPEILFMGSNYNCFPLSKLRLEMVKRLRAEFGGKVGIYGEGWSVSKNIDYANGIISSYDEEANAYRCCKIAINLSHFEYDRYTSDRLFRILGSGTFCLTHHYPKIEKDFTDGKDLVIWSDLDDLIKKIKYYLIFAGQRHEIAVSGCYKAMTNFTWHHFASNLLTIIKSRQWI